MKTGKLFVDKHELHLGRRIGKGGEGEVFAVSNMPGFVVKSYFPNIRAEREKKIRAMIAARLADIAPLVAFPRKIVSDERGAFAGFLMSLIDKHKEIHELQTPSSRQKHFPKVDYRFIVRVALNIARVFGQVHSAGCVVGDINQRGILVSPTGTVALIDADSFQFSYGTQRYLCVVGVPEYTPPELQGKSLKSVVRTTDHDAFGLAVCLFQLLCMDRHPFSGRFSGNGEMPLERAIAEYRFAYSRRNTGMIPPPGTVRIEDFTPKIAEQFEAAFSPNHAGRRPNALNWVQALGELEASLRPCNRNKLHHYSRSAKECPWCRMEREYGHPLFLDTDLTNIHVPTSRLDPRAGLVIDIPALMAAVNAVNIPTSIAVSIPQVQAPKPSAAAEDALSQKRLTPLGRVAGAGVIVSAGLVFSAGVPAIIALGVLAAGIWLLVRPASHEDELLSEYRKCANALFLRIQELQRTSPIDRVLQKKAEILDAIDEFKQLASAFGNVRSEYEKQRRQKQLDNYLSQFSIRGARIPKINSTDIAQLASYGFTTALHAKQRDVRQVHGIGPVKASNIAAWIRHIEGKFRFQSAHTPEDERNIRQAQNEIIMKQQGLEDRLKKLVIEFREEAKNFDRWKARSDPELVRLTQQLAQAEADLLHISVQVPPRPVVAPAPVPAVSTFQRKTPHPPFGATAGRAQVGTASVTCPRCGSPMVRRTARRGYGAGRAFWGCTRYPTCTGTRPI